MRDEYEMDLVELMEEAQQGDAWLDQPSFWESEISQVLAQQQEAKEVAAMADDFRPTIEALLSPGRVADEMLERSRYLRSRPLQNMKRRELEILSELAQMLSDPRFREALASTPEAPAAHRLLTEWEPFRPAA